MTCESAFHVAGMGLCGTQAKVAWRLSNGVVAAVYGESKKRWFAVTCESAL